VTWVFRINRSFLVGIAIIFFVIASSSGYWSIPCEESKTEVTQNAGQQTIPADSYILHGPIAITSNADFSIQGWPGNGTSGNPYVIEGLNIIAYSRCISISNTTVYFEVKNCIVSSTSSSLHEGIYLDDVIHGTIRNCVIERHYRGIYLYDSSYCTLTNNNATINYWAGYFLDRSDNCTLTNNTANHSSQFGFSLFSSYNITLMNNTANSNDCGFYLNKSKNCTLMENTLVHNGILIDGEAVSHWLHYFSGNMVNNKPLGYFKSLTSTIIDGSQYDQVILANCSEITVGNGVFTDTSMGLQLGFCVNCTLTNNTANNNSQSGLALSSSRNCTLMNNIAASNSFGFFLLSSDNCTLTNNAASNNSWYGFSLWSISYSTLTHNIATSNSYGYVLSSSHNCILMNNTGTSNVQSGFELISSRNCTLINNTAASNLFCGIYLGTGSEHNILYLNRLGNNGASNAQDDGGPNSWDDGVSLGNYWMDYDGVGTYAIPGDAGSVDNYPFVWKQESLTSTDGIILILVLSGAGIAVVVIVIVVSFGKRRK
jgi:parallel beta-helix repeat protein